MKGQGMFAMLLMQRALKLFRKYGGAARTVATGVLNVVSREAAACRDGRQRHRRGWRSRGQRKTRRLGTRRVERCRATRRKLARLGQLLDAWRGPSPPFATRPPPFRPGGRPARHHRPTIAADPTLSQVLHEVGGIKEQFEAFNADMKRLADRQEEAVPVYVRMNRVADYFDELWQAGMKPKDFAHCLRRQQDAVAPSKRTTSATWTPCSWICEPPRRKRPASASLKPPPPRANSTTAPPSGHQYRHAPLSPATRACWIFPTASPRCNPAPSRPRLGLNPVG